MDSFIFPVDLAYISPPPPRQILRRMVSRADLAKHHPPPRPPPLALPHPRVPTGDGDSPSNANVKHRRGEEERSFNAAVNRLFDDPIPLDQRCNGRPSVAGLRKAARRARRRRRRRGGGTFERVKEGRGAKREGGGKWVQEVTTWT